MYSLAFEEKRTQGAFAQLFLFLLDQVFLEERSLIATFVSFQVLRKNKKKVSLQRKKNKNPDIFLLKMSEREPRSSYVLYGPPKSKMDAFWRFFYWVSVVILGLAVEAALLASWQEAHYSNITTQWANAGLLIGVVLIAFMIIPLGSFLPCDASTQK